MVWSIGNPGNQSPWSLESWGKSILMHCLSLCDAYIEICNFGEIGDRNDQFLWFLNFGVVGCTEVVLHLGPFCLATFVSCGGHSDCFLEFFVGFSCSF